MIVAKMVRIVWVAVVAMMTGRPKVGKHDMIKQVIKDRRDSVSGKDSKGIENSMD